MIRGQGRQAGAVSPNLEVGKYTRVLRWPSLFLALAKEPIDELFGLNVEGLANP